MIIYVQSPICFVGVRFDAVSFSINSNQGGNGFRVFELDGNFQVSLDIDVDVASDSVSVTGTNLWEVTVFLSDASDGTGPRLVGSFYSLKHLVKNMTGLGLQLGRRVDILGEKIIKLL